MYKTSTPEDKLEEGLKQEENPLSFLHDVSLLLTLEMGQAEMAVRDLIKLKAGSVITLDKDSGESFDLRANGRLVARGEVVVVNDKYGVRITGVL